MRIFLLAVSALLLLTSQPVVARTWHVPSEAPTIQAGIDSAGVGDTVLVAPGTYTGDGNRDIDSGGKDVVVKSEGGAEITIIDCGGSTREPHRGFHFQNGESSEFLVEGLTIRNGNADHGGGIRCERGSAPTISHCILQDNTARGCGGGMDCLGTGHIAILGCVFIGNFAGATGGGLLCNYTSPPTLIGCDFTANVADIGGGLACWRSSSPVMSHCSFIHNTGSGGAGGISISQSPLQASECVFIGNVALGPGGAGTTAGCSVSLTRCVISDNSAGYFGGGFACDGGSSFQECRVSGNSADHGGALCLYGGLHLLSGCLVVGNYASRDGCIHGDWDAEISVMSCTVAENAARSGTGLYLRNASATLENTIIAFGVLGDAVHSVMGIVPLLTCCDIHGNEGGDWVGWIEDQYGVNGNISEDPLFCDPENGDFHLQCRSPCAPAQQPDCGLIGALGVGCGPTATVPSTWGLVKSIFELRGEK